jgi:WD40 repeat protein
LSFNPALSKIEFSVSTLTSRCQVPPPKYLIEVRKEALEVWDNLCDVLMDFEFLQAKLGTLAMSTEQIPFATIFDVLRNYQKSLATRQLPFAAIFDLLRNYQNTLAVLPADHPSRREVDALYRVLDSSSHALREDPSLLIQEVHNALVWDWDETTVLGLAVRQAARRYARKWWLKRLSRPAVAHDPALLRTLTGHTGWVLSVAFSPDGKTLASGSVDASVMLWDTETGKLKGMLGGHTGAVCATFSSDGKTVVSTDDKRVRRWDVQTGRLKRTDKKASNLRAVMSPDGKTSAIMSQKTVILCDVETRKKRTLREHRYRVSRVAFSPDSKTVFSSSIAFLHTPEEYIFETGEVIFWDVQTAELQWKFEHRNEVKAVTFSPDSKLVAFGQADATVTLWDVRTGESKQTLRGHSDQVNSVAFSPDGRLVASGSDDTSVMFWEMQGAKENQSSCDQEDRMDAAAFSSDGTTIVTSHRNKSLRLWDLQTGILKQTLTGHRFPVRTVAFSPDGVTVASGSSKWGVGGEVILWDAQTGKKRVLREGPRYLVEAVIFSPEGMTLAGAGEGTAGEIDLWDVQTGTLRRSLIGHEGTLYAVAFSPDGKTVATGSGDQTIKLWDMQTGALKHSLTGHTSSVYTVAFSPDGQTLASGGGLVAIICGVGAWTSGEVMLWNVQTGKLRLSLIGHRKRVLGVAFPHDNKMISSWSEDKILKLWDAKTGELLASIQCPDKVSAVWFDPVLPELHVVYESRTGPMPKVDVLEMVRR